MASMMEKISQKLHIGGHKKEDEHKLHDPAHASSGEPAAGYGQQGHAPITTPAAGYGQQGSNTELPHKEEKKHEGLMDKIKKMKGRRKEGKKGDSSDSD